MIKESRISHYHVELRVSSSLYGKFPLPSEVIGKKGPAVKIGRQLLGSYTR
jgi:hypothetical protein